MHSLSLEQFSPSQPSSPGSPLALPRRIGPPHLWQRSSSSSSTTSSFVGSRGGDGQIEAAWRQRRFLRWRAQRTTRRSLDCGARRSHTQPHGSRENVRTGFSRCRCHLPYRDKGSEDARVILGVERSFAHRRALPELLLLLFAKLILSLNAWLRKEITDFQVHVTLLDFPVNLQ